MLSVNSFAGGKVSGNDAPPNPMLKTMIWLSDNTYDEDIKEVVRKVTADGVVTDEEIDEFVRLTESPEKQREIMRIIREGDSGDKLF